MAGKPVLAFGRRPLFLFTWVCSGHSDWLSSEWEIQETREETGRTFHDRASEVTPCNHCHTWLALWVTVGGDYMKVWTRGAQDHCSHQGGWIPHLPLILPSSFSSGKPFINTILSPEISVQGFSYMAPANTLNYLKWLYLSQQSLSLKYEIENQWDLHWHYLMREKMGQ